MSTFRVLLADDSVTARRLLSETLSADPQLEVCLAARDGREAVDQFAALQPDIVLLDIEMPVMDGIEATVAIRRINTRVPIIMFSSLTNEGGAATLEALSHGATDFVTKPARSGRLQNAIKHLQQELIPKLKEWGTWAQSSRGLHPAVGRKAPAPKPSVFELRRSTAPMVAPPKFVATRPAAVGIVAIAASTGGPTALAQVLGSLPKQFPVPILITQHMPPLFTKLLADRLNQVCPLAVREAVAGIEPSPGEVWIAPGNQHLVVQSAGAIHKLRLDQGPPENSCRPSADVMLRSVVSVFGSRVLAVVLTGMGHDGLAGCRLVREHGGRVLVQDQASSVVWGMPRAVADAGLADRILPLNEIGSEINHLVLADHMARKAAT